MRQQSLFNNFDSSPFPPRFKKGDQVYYDRLLSTVSSSNSWTGLVSIAQGRDMSRVVKKDCITFIRSKSNTVKREKPFLFGFLIRIEKNLLSNSQSFLKSLIREQDCKMHCDTHEKIVDLVNKVEDLVFIYYDKNVRKYQLIQSFKDVK